MNRLIVRTQLATKRISSATTVDAFRADGGATTTTIVETDPMNSTASCVIVRRANSDAETGVASSLHKSATATSTARTVATNRIATSRVALTNSVVILRGSVYQTRGSAIVVRTASMDQTRAIVTHSVVNVHCLNRLVETVSASRVRGGVTGWPTVTISPTRITSHVESRTAFRDTSPARTTVVF